MKLEKALFFARSESGCILSTRRQAFALVATG